MTDANDNDGTNIIPAFKLASTSIACLVAGVITYPIESYRLAWEKKTFKYWNPEFEVINSKRFRVLSPLVRLTLNEGASNMMNSSISSIPFINTNSSSSDIKSQCLAGSIAGISQAFLLSPLEAWRANNAMEKEKMLSSNWHYFFYSQIMRGGSVNPEERRFRAFQGVGITAFREVMFNVTFFPLFYILRQHFREKKSCTSEQGETIISLTASGMIASSMCCLVVTPLDISKSYMMNSRERWSLWSGKKIHAAPIRVVARGLVVHALCFGPAFGLVAATYEWCG